jgi:RNA polymerase sigma-70 factor (ECF subfamily)
MTTLKELKEEKRLIKYALKGDKKALEKLVTKYINFCYSISLVLLENEKEAKLALEETLIQVHDKISELNNPKEFQIWLYDILKTSIYKFKQKGLLKMINEPGCSVNKDLYTNIKLQSSELYTSEKLWNILKSLPEDEREIVALIDFEGLSCNDTAVLLDLSLMDVRKKLFDAKKSLKEIFFLPTNESMVNTELVDVEKEF